MPEDGTYTVYTQYPTVTGAATNAAYTVTGSTGTAAATVDQTKNAGTWVSLGSYAFTQAGTGQKVSLAENSGGAVTADAIKIVRNNSGDTQPSPNSFTYSYDANGNLTDLADNSPGAQYNDYGFIYDGLNHLTQLQEKLSGTAKHTTSFAFDADSNLTRMTHDYSYDIRNLVTQVVNKETSSDAGKTTAYTYTPTAQIATETKGNGNVVTNLYNDDNSISSTVEKTSSGTLVASHTLGYDPNGNELTDASSVQNADDHSADVTKTATNTYTPADQLATVTNSNGSDNQSYTYDLAGNITAQTVGGTSMTNVYDRDRLLSTTAGGATANYDYDVFGRTDEVSGAGQVFDRYTYDGFDRVSSETKWTGTTNVTTNYAFDAFNRTLSQTDNAGTPSSKTTTFDYLSTSQSVVDEQVNGAVSKVYQYSPTGERLDQIIHNSDGTEDPTYYSYNPHSDVQAVTDSSGNTKSTYGYTAYGQDDTSGDTGVDKGTGSGATGSTESSPYDVYRFNADRIDDGSGTYNMGFRNYDPTINRFLSRDMYAGAFADQGMSTDPYTGNRYAFGGGNPLSNIELDGHDYSDGSSSPSSTDLVPYNGGWPPNDGAAAGWTWKTLQAGTMIDRYGSEFGNYFSPLGTPFDMRALPYEQFDKDYSIYMVAKPFAVRSSLAMPWFNKVGFGTQFKTELTAGELVKAGYLQRVARIVPASRQLPAGSSGSSSGSGGSDSTGSSGGSAASDASGSDVSGSDVAGDAAAGDSALSGALRFGGRALLVAGIAYDVYDVATSSDPVKTGVNDGVSLAGGLAGAAVGAEIGASIGGPAAPITGFIGGVVGGVVGSGLASEAVNSVENFFGL